MSPARASPFRKMSASRMTFPTRPPRFNARSPHTQRHDLRPERQYALISRQVRRPDHRCAPPQQEGMPHDLRLLLDPIAMQRQSRPERIVVPAKGVPHDRQEDALLMLPD